ncbi:MAG: HAD family hydrolase [Bacteroidales bacterium]|nr:HAD family hydrolase [Bacteroidales bacterium]
METKGTIIWDWNGTLLDDTAICLDSMNQMLSHRHLPLLTLEKYREVFTFPVIQYYTTIGFDFETEPWDKAAIGFIELYLEALPGAQLATGAIEMLEFFKQQGYQQAIISAMQHDALLKSVDVLGITRYFDYIGGIGDHYGAGKIENARNFFSDFNLSPSSVTLLGDTLHDAEVAEELGSSCILIANGHQSKQRLVESGHLVIDNLKKLLDHFLKNPC